MNISNDTPALNYVEYFTKQLPVDLANMAALRDELAVRQGALSAAQLKTAQDEAAAILADAKAENDASKVKAAELKAREKALDEQTKAFNASSAERETVLASREKAAAARDAVLEQTQANLTALSTKLAADQTALDERVKTFQDKVAALSA